MSAALHTLPRPAAGGRPPLVPAAIKLEDADYLRLECEIADTPWIQMSQPVAALAGIVLRIRALRFKEYAGSLPNDDRALAFAANFRSPTAIEDWKRHKTEALEGWVLCSDDRWYLPEVARNVLHIWIRRLEDRRISSWGNIAKKPTGGDYGIISVQEDITAALTALRAIDAQDKLLGKSTRQWHEWQERIEGHILKQRQSSEPAPDEKPNRSPNRSPYASPSGGHPKLSEAKLSEDSSSPLWGEDSSEPSLPLDLEVETNEGSVNRTARSEGPPSRASPWPPDASVVLRLRYPRKDGWGRAEKALERIRKAGKIPFEEILAGADRVEALVASGRQELRYTPMAVTWLNDRGWENPDPPEGGKPPPGPPGSPRFRNPYFRRVAEAVHRDRSP